MNFQKEVLIPKRIFKSLLIIFLLIQFLLSIQSNFNTEKAEAAGATYYLDVETGSDENQGTVDSPWKTIGHAIDAISSGDTVIIRQGIYRESLIEFGPSGSGPDQKTIFKAAPGERVVFSTDDDTPTQIRLPHRYIRIEGLWFGGRWEDNNEAFILGIRPGNELINNTFFGYNGSGQGYSEYNIYQGNRFVRCGWIHRPEGSDLHAVYLSGGYTPGKMGQHTIVDNNIFIAGAGYAVHGWHNWRSSIITRNFIAGHNWGLVVDGSDHLVANNFFWRQTGLSSGNNFAFGPYLAGDRVLFFNNIMGPDGGIYPLLKDSNQYVDNAFLDTAPRGENPIILNPGNELNDLGISAEELDQTIAALDAAFSQPVADIYKDTSIEPAFAKLKLAIPKTSPLYRSGVDWFDHGSAINLGPDAPAPESMDDFWDAFHANDLCDWDENGVKVSCGPDPTPSPTPEPTPNPTSDPTPNPTSDPTPEPKMKVKILFPIMAK